MAWCEDRGRRRAEHRIRAAHLPRERSLREFDCSVNPNVDPAVIHNSPPASGSPRVTRCVLYRHIVVADTQLPHDPGDPPRRDPGTGRRRLQ
ncbi:hypothetical protein [Streptomyces albogriseolus]|uniref:hypothetical protein n=1 Tax=Streptomyces albogriseolus TaxID=1887 RepID=UPI003F4D39EF